MRIRRRVVAWTVVGVVSMAMLIAAGAAGAVDAPPAAHWAFDEGTGGTASDSVGTLDGSLSGPSWISSGYTGAALRFDGIDDVVTIPADTKLSSPRMAVSLWVRGSAASPPADGAIILERGDRSCAGGDYAFAVDGNGVELRIRDDQTGQVRRIRVPAGSMASLWNGAWHHVGMNYVADTYGGASLLIDGNFHGGETISSLAHASLDISHLTIGRAARADCGRPAFRGDIDDVRLFDDVVSRDGFGAMEPPIPTTTTIVQVEPLGVGTTGIVTVDIDPVPISGWIRLYFVDANGDEHLVGAREIEYWMPPPADGRWTVGATSDWGGPGTLIARSQLGHPHVSSSATVAVTIAKRAVTVSVSTLTTYVAGEPIRLGALIAPVGPNVSPSGGVELYDITTPSAVLVASAQIVVNPNRSYQGVEFTLPPRAAGTYRFEARYLGGIAHLPGNGSSDLVVLPALVTGDVVINGGAEVTSDPIVTVAAPAEGAIALWVSNDPTDIRRFYTTPYSPEITTWLTAPWYGDDADGVRTIWIKWADHQNRWSDWKTDTIVLDRGLPTGTVTIDDGAQYATDRTLSVGVPVPNPDLVTEVGLSTDGINFTTFPYASSIDWLAPAVDGSLTIHARWRDTSGRWSMTRSDTIVIDTSGPTATPPTWRISSPGSVPASRAIPVNLAWGGADPISGIARFELRQSTDGAAWTTVSTSLTSTSMNRNLLAGHTYRFVIRAIDKAGNAGAWAVSPTSKLAAYQEGSRAIRWSGTWRTGTSLGFWGGRDRYATAAGARASLTFTGRSFAWVGSVGPTRGWARIYVNGTLVRSINLRAATTANRRILFATSWSTVRSRTVMIRISGTPGHPRGDIDTLLTW